MSQHDPDVACPRGLRRFDELLLAEREEEATHDPGDGGPEQQREDDPGLEGIPGAEEDRRRQQDGEAGHGEKEIGETHQQVVDLPGVVAGDGADDRADERREDRDHHGHPQRGPDPEHDPAQVVAPELVGAEQVPALERRLLNRRLEVDLVIAVGRELRREDADERDQEQDDQAHDRQPVAQEAHTHVGPLTPRFQVDAGLGRELGARTRGNADRVGSERHASGTSGLQRIDARTHS